MNYPWNTPTAVDDSLPSRPASPSAADLAPLAAEDDDAWLPRMTRALSEGNNAAFRPDDFRHGSEELSLGTPRSSRFPLVQLSRDNAALNELTVNSVASNLALFEDDGTNRRPVSALLQRDTMDSGSTTGDRRPLIAPAGQPWSAPPSLGIMEGVFLPCLQNILSIILFVRLPWIVGIAGVGVTLGYLAVAVVCTMTTTLSISALIANGVNAAGGAYYMISRTLGREVGGSIGILYYLSTTISVAIAVLGAMEVLADHVIPTAALFDDRRTFGRVFGFAALCAITAVTMLRLRTLYRLASAVILLTLACLVLVFGGLLASNRLRGSVPGIVGIPGDLGANFGPHFSSDTGQASDTSWIRLFALFFPCVTGVMAGANKSGLVVRPSTSIPRGTLAAIGVSTLVYLAFILLLGAVATGELLRNRDADRTTGLVFALVAWPHPAVGYAATIAAALGAALQSTTGAQRVLRAMARDSILGLDRLLPTDPTAPNPWWGGFPALVTFTLSAAAILVGDLDLVAPVVTLAYLLTYSGLNVATAVAAWTRPPGWRPTWPWYHWGASVLGSAVCVACMALINPWASLASVAAVVAIYRAVEIQGATGHWGGEAIWALRMQVAQRNLVALERMPPDAARGTWRPQLIAFLSPEDDDDEAEHAGESPPSETRMDPDHAAVAIGHAATAAATARSGSPPAASSARHLVAFVGQLKKGGGLSLVCRCICDSVSHATRTQSVARETARLRLLLAEQRVEALPEVLVCRSLVDGITSTVQSAGVGVLRPNTVVLGFPTRSRQHARRREQVHEFVEIVRNVIALDKALLLVKGLTEFPLGSEVWSDAAPRMSGTIDVYWIVHDGGMMALLPWLLKRHAVWRGCWLRIFAVAQLTDNSILMRQHLVESLDALRIAAEARVLELGDHDISEFTYEKTMRLEARQMLLDQLAAATAVEQGDASAPVSLGRRRNHSKSVLTRSASFAMHLPSPATRRAPDKHRVDYMNTSVKLNSLMRENSSEAELVFCNLPAPTSQQTAIDYIEYLEALCAGLSRVVLVKGTGLEVV
ncbi:hypothetical protein H9P43_007504 [Blastocladiella emersonii ATCC 22665]|nr:hypothetical protein H9P43_007504 [Blastocladiella emersonii ATCC 22665]